MTEDQKEIVSKPCTVPVAVPAYSGPADVEYKRGVYTGYSSITKKHYFSLYNGECIQRDTLVGVQFDKE